jgi:hypothetical protein
MKNLSLFASALAVLGLTACEKTLVDDIADVGNGQVKNSVLQVRTRAGGSADEATVTYPVTVYVFASDECRAMQTIGDEGQTLNIPLVEGTYSVYAVGGASASDYVLPDASDALATSAIALCEGHEHGDLMAASATATLVDGGTNTVTLGMTRKTMLIQDVTIKKIPTVATAVSVKIAPLWQSLTIGGTYSTTNGNCTIALTRQEDGRTWQNTVSVYLLPPCSQPASVSVNITVGGTTKTYTYSCSDQLEVGYKINIDGTYTEAVGVNLTGTITGATWLGERTISFEFDESGSSTSAEDNSSSGDENGNIVGDLPTVGTLYQGCYVLTNDGTTATLLSPNEEAIGTKRMDFATTADMEDAIAERINQTAVDDISGWRLPTVAELNRMYSATDDINAVFSSEGTTLTATRKFLYTDNDGNVVTRTLNQPDMAGVEDFQANAYVCPVVTIIKQPVGGIKF